jgi:site-specific recombinase XerD
LQNGEDLVALQRQMGHTSIAVTQLYVARNYADVKAHRTTSPMRHVRLIKKRR